MNRILRSMLSRGMSDLGGKALMLPHLLSYKPLAPTEELQKRQEQALKSIFERVKAKHGVEATFKPTTARASNVYVPDNVVISRAYKNPEKTESVLGHELGHIYYPKFLVRSSGLNQISNIVAGLTFLREKPKFSDAVVESSLRVPLLINELLATHRAAKISGNYSKTLGHLALPQSTYLYHVAEPFINYKINKYLTDPTLMQKIMKVIKR